MALFHWVHFSHHIGRLNLVLLFLPLIVCELNWKEQFLHMVKRWELSGLFLSFEPPCWCHPLFSATLQSRPLDLLAKAHKVNIPQLVKRPYTISWEEETERLDTMPSCPVCEKWDRSRIMWWAFINCILLQSFGWFPPICKNASTCKCFHR